MNISHLLASFSEQSAEACPAAPRLSSAVFPACQLPCFFRGLPCAFCGQAFFNDHLCCRWFLLQERAEAFRYRAIVNARISLLPSFVFVCPSNWGFRKLYADNCRKASRDILSGKRWLVFFYKLMLPRIIIHNARQLIFKPFKCVPPSCVEMLFAKE